MIKERINVGLSKARTQGKKVKGQKFLWKLKVKFANSDQLAEATEKLQLNLGLN